MVVRSVAGPGGHQHLLLVYARRPGRLRRRWPGRRTVVLVVIRGRSTGRRVRWCSRWPSVVERYVMVRRAAAVVEVAGLMVRSTGIGARVRRLRQVMGRHLWQRRRVLEASRSWRRRVVRRDRRRVVLSLRRVTVAGWRGHGRGPDRYHLGVGRLGRRWCGRASRRRRCGHRRRSQRRLHVRRMMQVHVMRQQVMSRDQRPGRLIIACESNTKHEISLVLIFLKNNTCGNC